MSSLEEKMTEQTRRCTRCNRTLPVFAFDRRRGIHRLSWCRECGVDWCKTHNRERYNSDPIFAQKMRDASYKSKSCKILKQHHEILKDDPEHLTTEFLAKLIGVECKKNKTGGIE